MMNRPATMNPFFESLLVFGRGGRLPQKHLIGSSIQAIGSRALRSKEEHSIKRHNNRLKPTAAAGTA